MDALPASQSPSRAKTRKRINEERIHEPSGSTPQPSKRLRISNEESGVLQRITVAEHQQRSLAIRANEVRISSLMILSADGDLTLTLIRFIKLQALMIILLIAHIYLDNGILKRSFQRVRGTPPQAQRTSPAHPAQSQSSRTRSPS